MTELAMRKFIIWWIETYDPVCATDTPFHEAFFARFGGKRKEANWGAQTVNKAMRLLKKMYDEGELSRVVVGIGGRGNWQPGFPRWNYVYYTQDHHDNITKRR